MIRLYDMNFCQLKNSWGVFNGFCSKKAKDANHGVLIAGYTKSKIIFRLNSGVGDPSNFLYSRTLMMKISKIIQWIMPILRIYIFCLIP